MSASQLTTDCRAAEPVLTVLTERLVVLDILRGVAMLLMALEHSAWFAHTNYVAETYGRASYRLDTLPHILIGLMTNTAAGVFFTLTGSSVAFFENSRRRRGWSEGHITRFFIVRALILLVLDWILSRFGWQQPTFYFDVLSALAFALVTLAFIRRLPLWVIGVVAIALFFLYPALVDLFPYDPAQPWTIVNAYLFQYHNTSFPWVEFPALGRLSLVLMGYVAGRLLIEGRITLKPGRILLMAAGSLILGITLRLVGGYGNFTPLAPGSSAIDIFIESKQPPSMVFLLYNIAKGLTLLALLQAVSGWLCARSIGKLLSLLGQTSLFFYAAHLFLFRYLLLPLLNRIFPDLTGIPLSFVMTMFLIIILAPACSIYRGLRRQHPNSILQYL